MKGPSICAYCGRASPETRDHIPPKGIFPDPLPSDLITVPCCNGCHSDTAKDDEHFRNVLLSASNLEQEPRAKRARDGSIQRSLDRPEQTAYWERFVDAMEDGIPINEGILRVVARIARGLYFHEFQIPLPQTHEVRAKMDQFGSRAKQLTATLGITWDRRSAAGGQFAYGFWMVPGDPASGIWIGEFFGRVLALAFFVEK